MKRDSEIPPDEDALLDRCLEFINIMTYPSQVDARNILFRSIMTTVGCRIREDLGKNGGKTAYYKCTLPFIYKSLKADDTILREANSVPSGIQERFVSEVIEVLRKKHAITMVGGMWS